VTATTLSGNTSKGNGDNGFGASEADNNLFEANLASGNVKGFAIELATGTRLLHNVSNNNSAQGFGLYKGAHGNV